MPRALTVRTARPPASAREAFVADARRCRDALRAHGCSLWLYRRAAAPGAAGAPGTSSEAREALEFVEFMEARDAATLLGARAAVGREADGASLYIEVEWD